MKKKVNEINKLTVQFNNKRIETIFLKSILPAQIKFFINAALIGIIATLLFLIPDYVKSGWNEQFVESLVSRMTISSIVLFFIYLVKRIKNPYIFHYILFVIALAITVNTTFVIIKMNNHSVIYAMSEVIAIMVYYLFLQQRFLFSLTTAISGTIIIFYAHLHFGNLDPVSLQTIFMAFLLTNIFGIIYNRNLNYSLRQNFSSLEYEKRINNRLEKEIIQRQKLEQTLIDIARIDSMTGLYNRRFFIELCEKELNKQERYRTHFSLLMIDCDHFKNINDKFGHAQGDNVLIALSKVFQTITRKSDIVARVGGEEFMIILEETNLEDAYLMAEKIRKEISEQMISHHHITVSIGVTQSQAQDNLESILSRVDKALYSAKTAGRNRVVKA